MAPEPRDIAVVAPATVANLGPGFDVLGLALVSPCDTVRARLVPGQEVIVTRVTGDDGKLKSAKVNTAAVAARATLERAGIRRGIEIELHKGLPIGSGLGSSAASAVAAAYAVNMLIGSPLRKTELLGPCIEAEAAVSGRHADNVAPSLLGGLVMIRSVDPLEFVRVPVPESLMLALAIPHYELETRAARQALPAQAPLEACVHNAANLATFVAACFSNHLGLLGRCVDEAVVTAARAHLVPGCEEVMAAARRAGALGSGISGAGPAIFALCHSAAIAEQAAAAMVQAFRGAGLEAEPLVSPADCPGVRTI